MRNKLLEAAKRALAHLEYWENGTLMRREIIDELKAAINLAKSEADNKGQS